MIGWKLCNFLSRSGLISLGTNQNVVLYISISSKTTPHFTSLLGTEITSFNLDRRGRVSQVTLVPLIEHLHTSYQPFSSFSSNSIKLSIMLWN
jgi:hypothetical protein